MKNVSKEMMDVQENVLNTSVAMTRSYLSLIEKLTLLNLATARTVLEDASKVSQQLKQANTPQEAMANLTALTQPSVARAAEYCQSVQEITRQAGEAFGTLIKR